MKSIYLFLCFFCFSCFNGSIGKGRRFPKIDESNIEIAEIKKNYYDKVSVRLTRKQIHRFTNYINNSSGSEMMKVGPKYWIKIKYYSDSILTFKIYEDLIGWGDAYIKIDDANYFKNIYENGSKKSSCISLK